MQQEQMKTQIEEQDWQLVKFDGEAPAPGEMKEPAEIVEGGPDKDTSVTYRKGEGNTVKYFTGNSDGYAELAKEEKK